MAGTAIRWLLPVALAALASGCLELKQKLVLNADGSGELQCHYLLTPAALTTLQTDPFGLYGAWLTPVLQPFPSDERRVTALAAGDGLALRDLKVAATADGGRQLDYVITFTNIRAFARSPAAALCRFHLGAAVDGAATLQVKALGLDYLDWRLPRTDPALLAATFAELQAAATGLRYELAVQVPGPILDGNARQLNGTTATWTWRGEDLRLADVIGPDQGLRLPTLRFRADQRQAPVLASPELAVPVVPPALLRVSCASFTAEPVTRREGDLTTFGQTRITCQFLVGYPENLTPVAYETPVFRAVVTTAGEDLAVPLPPLFGHRVRLDPAAGGPRQFHLSFMLHTARQLDSLAKLRGSFALTYAEGEPRTVTLPALGQWPAAGIVQTTPAGRQLRLSLPQPERLVIEYEPDADLEVQTLVLHNEEGEPLMPARRSRGVQPPNPPASTLTRVTTLDLPPGTPETVTLSFFTQLRTVRVPFTVLDLKRGQSLPPVTVEEPAGRTLLLTQRFQAHPRDVRAVAVSPDGRLLASGGAEARVAFWQLATGAHAGAAEGHPAGVNALAFLPDGKRLVSAGRDRRLKLWAVPSGQDAGTFAGEPGDIRGLASSADGKRLLAGGLDGQLAVWDVGALTLIRALPGHSRGVRGVALAADGSRALSAGLDGKVILWDTATAAAVATLASYKPAPRAVALAADGRLAAATGDDMLVHLYDLGANREIRAYHGHANLITAVAFLPGGDGLAASDMDGGIKVWDLASDHLRCGYQGDNQAVLSLAATPDGRRLIAGTSAGQVLVLELPEPDQ